MPNHKNFPAEGAELPKALPIPFLVRIDFRDPKNDIRFGQPSFPTIMAVPKAAVDKNDLFAGAEYNVGLPRQVFAMEPITIAEGV